MERCVRCNARTNKDAFVCEACLEMLCMKYGVPKGQDPLENQEIKLLIQSYKEMNGRYKK